MRRETSSGLTTNVKLREMSSFAICCVIDVKPTLCCGERQTPGDHLMTLDLDLIVLFRGFRNTQCMLIFKVLCFLSTGSDIMGPLRNAKLK